MLSRSLRVATILVAVAAAARAQQPTSSADPLQRALRADGSTAATRRQQIFEEAFSGASAPRFVPLDSGVTYRVFAERPDTVRTLVTVTLASRNEGQAPIRLTGPALHERNRGMAFQAPVGGEYRVTTDYTGRDPVLVRIVSETDAGSATCAMDAASGACIAVDQEEPRRRGISPMVIVMAGFLPLLFVGMMRNGKSF